MSSSGEQESPLNLLNKRKFKNSQEEEKKMTSQDERQFALANLLSSLTNSATTNNRQVDESANQQVGAFDLLPGASEGRADSQSGQVTAMAAAAAAAVMMQQQQQQQQSLLDKSAFLACDPINLYEGKQQQDFMYSMNQQQQVQQQRINYCTICNKELCNKYFMKTHMLKMHGINLEMEQPSSDSSSNSISNSSDEELNEEPKEESTGTAQPQAQGVITSSSGEASTMASNSTGVRKKCSTIDKSSKRAQQQQQQQQGRKNFQQAKQQVAATSVMNGFAGNSMGGVVCDICNKELCSKYFLKVHKQNTHGVMSEHEQVSSGCHQFMYNPFADPNPFVAPHLSASLEGTPSIPTILTGGTEGGGLIFGSGQVNLTELDLPATAQVDLMANQQSAVEVEHQNRAKRARFIDTTASHEASLPISSSQPLHSPCDSNKLQSVYRLMLSQQQQQQQRQTTLVDPMGANGAAATLNALMCFGAIGAGNPISSAFLNPAGSMNPIMSPAMIVESILRNQHLFQRQKQQQQQQQQSTDRNNNSSVNSHQAGQKKCSVSQQKGASSLSAGASSNSRYFSHYTEACPMCDRRFKSIKWLKTHMINDHKQEISAYMQMMMQYFYASKSQQMAATVASIAAFKQQQQQSFAQQQHDAAMKNRSTFKPQQTLTPPQAANCINTQLQFQANHNKHLTTNSVVSPFIQQPQQKSDIINEKHQHENCLITARQQQASFMHFQRPEMSRNASSQQQQHHHHQLPEGENFVIDARRCLERAQSDVKPFNLQSATFLQHSSPGASSTLNASLHLDNFRSSQIQSNFLPSSASYALLPHPNGSELSDNQHSQDLPSSPSEQEDGENDVDDDDDVEKPENNNNINAVNEQQDSDEKQKQQQSSTQIKTSSS